MTDHSAIQLAVTPPPEIGSHNTASNTELVTKPVATVIGQRMVFSLNDNRQPLPNIKNGNLQWRRPRRENQ